MPVAGIELTLRTLLRSPNPKATELLLVALQSDDATLRIGAVRALAQRADETGHRGLVERFPRLSADAQAAIADVPCRAPLASSLAGMIHPSTPRLARRAADLAVAWGATPTLPVIVEAALWPAGDFTKAFSEAALALARLLDEQVRRYDPAARRAEEDPAFARRSAVNALVGALDKADSHRSPQLIEALLLLAAADEPALVDALRNEQHVAHQVLLTTLRGSTSHGTLRVLAKVLEDTRTPQSLLEIAADRSDPVGLTLLLQNLGHPVGVRVRKNCARIDDFRWLDSERMACLLEMPGKLQATAVTIAAASRAERRRVAALICLLLESGNDGSRTASCRAIETLPDDLAHKPLKLAIASDNGQVVAAAAALLRQKRCPGAVETLVKLLDHVDDRVRAAAQRSLRELSFTSFRSYRHEMSADLQRRLGHLVGKADPLVVPTLQAELNSGAVSRRLAALELIDLTGAVEELAEELTRSVLSESDTGVRVEIALLLGQVRPAAPVLEALQEAANDRSRAVREAAERSLGRLGTGPVLAAGGV